MRTTCGGGGHVERPRDADEKRTEARASLHEAITRGLMVIRQGQVLMTQLTKF